MNMIISPVPGDSEGHLDTSFRRLVLGQKLNKMWERYILKLKTGNLMRTQNNQKQKQDVKLKTAQRMIPRTLAAAKSRGGSKRCTPASPQIWEVSGV